MEITIRQETPNDYVQVYKVVRQAFSEMELSNGDEQDLVERLRGSEAFVPGLSLVADVGGIVVGHILLTKLVVNNGREKFDLLGLAPVSVLPEFQKKGVGSKLISASHRIALDLGYDAVVLIGHPDYYPRFGYRRADEFGIEFPFEAPADCCLVAELTEGAMAGVSGMVEYPKEFF